MAGEGDKLPFRMTPPPDMDEEQQPELRRVAGPANGLMITASLALILNCLGGMALFSLSSATREATRPPGMSDEEFESYERGRESAQFLQACGIGLPTLLIYPLAIVGGLRMKQRRNYPLALASSILVMLPCSLTFLVGIPVGVWAIVVLNDPGVKAVFR
jgi:hypothetical protein